VTYLHKLGFDLGRRLPELFPRGELGVALDLADALLPVQLMRAGQGLFDALDKRLDEVFTRRRVQRRLSRGDAEEIVSLAPEPDLIHRQGLCWSFDGVQVRPELGAIDCIYRCSLDTIPVCLHRLSGSRWQMRTRSACLA